MPKTNITQYSSTPSSNTDINNINIDENCPASGLNNAIRELMAHLKNVDTGSQALTALSVTGNVSVGGTFTSTGIDDNASSTAMTLDSSGNVLVGVSSVQTQGGTTAGTSLYGGNNAGLITAGRNGDVLRLNRHSTDGDIAVFRKDGTTVGSIGYESSGFHINGEANHSGLSFQAPNVTPRYNGSLTDDFVHLGSTSNRFKNLYLSGGVYVGGTGSANYLDDYEEGTFTPTLQASVTNPTVTYGTQTGAYTKVGRLVRVDIYLITSSYTGGSGNLIIGDLPFASASSVTFAYSTGPIVGYKVNTQAEAVLAIVQASNQAKILTRSDTSTSGTWNFRAIGDWTSSGTTGIQASISYVTDS